MSADVSPRFLDSENARKVKSLTSTDRERMLHVLRKTPSERGLSARHMSFVDEKPKKSRSTLFFFF